MENRRETRLVGLVDLAERVVYYLAAVFLLATIGVLFYAAVVDFVAIGSAGPLATALSVLDTVLLIFIFTELLGTITTIVRENGVRAEPFLLIGLIAVVRRILAVTASIEQSLGTPQFVSLLYELGVLTALVVALVVALYFARSLTEHPHPAGTAPNEG